MLWVWVWVKIKHKELLKGGAKNAGKIAAAAGMESQVGSFESLIPLNLFSISPISFRFCTLLPISIITAQLYFFPYHLWLIIAFQFAVIHLKCAIMLPTIFMLKLFFLIHFGIISLFPATSLSCKTPFFSTKLLLLSWTATGNSGNFPSQIFRSPPYYLLPTGYLFFGYFLRFFRRIFKNFLPNFSPLDTSQIFWLPASCIFSNWHLFHLIPSLFSFCFCFEAHCSDDQNPTIYLGYGIYPTYS